MLIKKSLLRSLGVTDARADKYLPDLKKALPEHQIDTPLRMAHFLAQVLHESARLRYVKENLNYSAQALLRVFRKYFTPSQAQIYARKPKRIANRVYASRMGNGDEASADGYRYRGRGFIQLTGKNNYRKFSQWIGDDVVVQPDVVAHKYAVYSAVYYWVSHHLNALADIDDIKQVTKTVNGGYNGLEDRIALLDKTKELLAIDTLPLSLKEITHKVTASRLNLRRLPLVSPSTRIGTLIQGAEIMKIADSSVVGWVKVRAVLDGQIFEGFVADQYLVKIPPKPAVPVPPPILKDDLQIPPVHLSENRRDITRLRDGGRAYPLGERGRPRRIGSYADTKVRRLIEIINYLDCELINHKRWWPRGGTTYCNIYACDYCYLANVYLPRVWWTAKALQRIRDGREISVTYGDTVRELNANMLLDWFEDYGFSYGWQRVVNLDVLQAAANNGEVCIIVAQRKDRNRSGHITAVVPEHDNFKAARNPSGEVLRPVESQAGVKNHRFVTKTRAWWVESRYESFGFWRHV
ncbi:MAG: glycoside hydrolase family 19 protein [Deltaproteobacteria bacterium]|nr:glycoside hydrolase family 19 protein [Deltaproteobacteria bacterium]